MPGSQWLSVCSSTLLDGSTSKGPVIGEMSSAAGPRSRSQAQGAGAGTLDSSDPIDFMEPVHIEKVV
jgi:hypothetical protein